MGNYGFLILAAGSSSRLGKPKQLLDYKGKPLLQHAIDITTSLNRGQVLTIVGANSDLVCKTINFHDTHVIVHEHWEEGMGSTISFGITHVTKLFPEVNGVVILVCDQPFISTKILNELIDTHEKEKRNIVASSYGNTLGTPAFFHQSLFKELIQLKGQEGAKKIIYRHEDNLSSVAFPEGKIDIDTVEDYDQLRKH